MEGEMSSQQLSRRKIHGPRPAPLKICRDSHNIRKPQLPLAAMPYRPPVIIYLHSPEVIHTEAREFMALVQRLTGRVNAHGDSTMPSVSSSFQSQTCHALPNSHTSVIGNPNGGRVDLPGNPNGGRVDLHGNPNGGRGRVDDSPSCHPGGGPYFLVKEDKCIVSGDSNPPDFPMNVRSQYSTVQSLLSPTIPSASISPLSPSFFFPSPRLLSPNIFQEFPLHPSQPDYLYDSPGYMLCIQSEPIFTPPARPAMNAVPSLPSPSPTDCDLLNNNLDYSFNLWHHDTAAVGWHSDCNLKA